MYDLNCLFNRMVHHSNPNTQPKTRMWRRMKYPQINFRIPGRMRIRRFRVRLEKQRYSLKYICYNRLSNFHQHAKQTTGKHSNRNCAFTNGPWLQIQLFNGIIHTNIVETFWKYKLKFLKPYNYFRKSNQHRFHDRFY